MSRASAPQQDLKSAEPTVWVHDHRWHPTRLHVHRGNQALHVVPRGERSFLVKDEDAPVFFCSLLSSYGAQQKLEIVSAMLRSVGGFSSIETAGARTP